MRIIWRVSGNGLIWRWHDFEIVDRKQLYRNKLFRTWRTRLSVGVGRFVTNDCWKRGGVFYLFLTDFDVIEWAWAWGVLSPMTAGSVGAFFIYF